MSKNKVEDVSVDPKEVELTEEEKAVQVLQAREQKDITDCEKEVGAVLAKYKCGLQFVQLFTNGVQAGAEVRVVKQR